MKKIYLLAALVFLASSLSGQTDLVKHPDNPVLEPGTAGEWDEGSILGGSVIFLDDTFRMWYSKGLFAEYEKNIGYTTSADGIHWTKYPDNPVLFTGPAGSWDEGRVIFPTVLMRDNVFHMWYIGQPAGSDNLESKVGHATSTDGIYWVKDSQNPLLDKGSVGSPDAGYLLGLSAIHDDSLYHMWYGANNDVDDYLYTCHATSQDGITWSKDPENPVLTGDAWDNPICIPGPVLFNGSAFQMWYIGSEEGSTRKAGYATSADGTVWVKPSDSPVLTGGQPGEWDEEAVAKGIFYDSINQKYMMWYSAGPDGIGYAESTVLPDPTIEYSHSMEDQITIFPNPVIDLLNVQTGLSEDHFIEIASLNGQVVYSMTMDRPASSIDLSLLEKGIYYITIRSTDFVTTRKIIKM